MSLSLRSAGTLEKFELLFPDSSRVFPIRSIGRPSTFSSIISKIQDRGYVSKEDVKGKELLCSDYKLIDNHMDEIELKREFGNEKNKIRPE